MRKILVIGTLLLMATGVFAQSGLHKVDWRKARITDVGTYMMDMRINVKQDARTQKLDTTFVDNSRILWQSQGYDVENIENNDFFKEGELIDAPDIQSGDEEIDSLYNFIKTGVRRANVRPYGQEGCLQDIIFNKFYYNVYMFEYPSVDAAGKPVTLSAMCACPTKKGASRINNIILGTHVTITANRQRPSAQTNNWKADDWGMYFSLAAGNKLNYKSWMKSLRYFGSARTGLTLSLISILRDSQNGSRNAAFNNNLVIMPDYEGYGQTSDRAHPYLYQELTARQCIDALYYGIDLYESSPDVKEVRHPIRSNYRTIVSGYSQGGSVAMACHRFIEQNGLAKDLHFVGSYCGDGPYDPMATLMFYMKEDLAGNKLKMPVVLPLIIKGMLDSNPFMKAHKASEYFTQEFLDTGIMQWLADKNSTTDNIADKFTAIGAPLFDNEGQARLRDVMNAECYAYFKKLYQNNKDTYTSAAGVPLPAHRGVMEDLHRALASNNLTVGWKPEHTIYLFHSSGDHVVPIDNFYSAKNRLGSKMEAGIISGKEHVDAGVAFFSQDEDVNVILFDGLRLNSCIEKLANLNY
jgi:hypothetical protein